MNDDQKFLDLNGLRHLAQKEREAYNSMIIVSDEKPLNQPYNKVWMKETTEEFAVPTYAEFTALKQRVDTLDPTSADSGLADDVSSLKTAFNDTLTLLAAVKTALENSQDDTAVSLLDTFLIGHGYLA